MILKKNCLCAFTPVQFRPAEVNSNVLFAKKIRNITNILQSKTNKNSTKNNQLEQLKED